MQCHYEVLDVPRDASLEDLKKSYRKLVLQWHPDKNLNNVQECKEKFQLIQQAYDILSDPQERAWYDKHRDDILKGGENYKDNSLNVFQYFRTSCYTGFEDDEKGFFTVYRGVFENLAAEDTPFMDQEELLPSFGNSTSSYDEVVHLFYSYWQSYCTAKTYVWIEAYDIREAPNRRVVRLMEKENKKLRDLAKKARNEEIRELVAFVRKRDPRVQAHKQKLEEKKTENLRRAELNRKNAILERKKELSKYNECEWSNMSKLEAGLKELEAQLDNQFGRESYSDSDDNDEADERVNDLDQQGNVDSLLLEEESSLYCIACDKVFQSERAKLNHDNSKKHRENVALLKEALEEEDNLLMTQHAENGVSEPSDRDELEEIHNSTEEILDNHLQSSGSDSEAEKVKSRTKASRKKKKALKVQDAETDDEVVELGPPEIVLADEKEDSEELNSASTEKKGKKKRRRTKQEKSASSVAVPTVAPVEDLDDSETEPPKIICGTCKSKFSSRNKLFSHLKVTNHSMYLEDKAKISAPEKPTKGKGRKGKTRQRDD